MNTASADPDHPRQELDGQKDGEAVTEVGAQKAKKRKWLGLVLTTFLGIAATLGVGWYQVSQSEKQAVLAEEERARGVRESLVSIVEEHVLNDRTIDMPRLARLIDQRRREERVTTPITVAELLEQAEFNILGSRYLPFERKQSVRSVFDTLYSDLGTRAFATYSSDESNADLLNTLARQIQDGKSSDALQTLKRLQEAHVKDLQQARAGQRVSSLRDALTELLKDPWPLLATAVLYIVVLSWMIARRPQLLSWLRRLPGRRLPAPVARERIARYLGAGMPEEMIVDRLFYQGVPREWAFEQIARVRAQQAKPREARPNPQDTET